jgi:hypothetical protein
MRILPTFLVWNFVFCASVVPASGAPRDPGDPIRVELKSGAPPTILKGQVEAGKGVVYRFQAKAGSRFEGVLTVRGGDPWFEISDPDGTELPEEEFEQNRKLKGSLVKTGDYTLVVQTYLSKTATYTLNVRVR